MSTQDRSSEQGREPSPGDARASVTPDASAAGTNLLQRWVRLVQSAGLYGNDAGQLRLDELAQGPTTPRIQTLEEIRAARKAAIAEEEAAEGTGSTSWWRDAICAEEEPERAELPPIFTPPPLMVPPTTVSPIPPALPVAAGEGLLARMLAFGARWLGPVVVGMLPKSTAPPEMTDRPYTGPEGGTEPVGDELPKDDNKCKANKVDHHGGHALHDMCADTLPGNSIPGNDLQVRTPTYEVVNYDAWSEGDNTVWEVKTDRYSTWSDWLRGRHLGEQVEAFREQNRIARECGYGFKVSVSDEAHFLELLVALAPDGIPVEHREDCPNDEP